MLWIIAVVLTVLWLLGLISSYTMGGFIHVLLVIAVVLVLVNVIRGRKPPCDPDLAMTTSGSFRSKGNFKMQNNNYQTKHKRGRLHTLATRSLEFSNCVRC